MEIESQRIPVLKTRKLFIGGQFPRSESGRSRPLLQADGKHFLANICLASRKDVRDGVQAARKALANWANKTAYNRGQILYRMAELMEARRRELEEELQLSTGCTSLEAQEETNVSIDRLIWYAGFCDKISQVIGNANPVALPYFNFTIPEPVGVVGLICPDQEPLISLITFMAPIIAGGNTVVIYASEKYPTISIALSEILATSDLPGGVVNILTGDKKELAPVFAAHMDINALALVEVSADLQREIESQAAENVKRVRMYSLARGDSFSKPSWQSVTLIADFLELKTVWHPIGV